MNFAAFMSTVDDDNERANTLRAERNPKLDAESYILVVEDDPDIRGTVVETLEAEGYYVREAADGKSALAVLDLEYYLSQLDGRPPRVPSVILLDLMMPVMSGTELYAVIRNQRPVFASVPIIVMSADPNVRHFEWVISTAGVEPPEGVLPKPFDTRALIEKVRRATGGEP